MTYFIASSSSPRDVHALRRTTGREIDSPAPEILTSPYTVPTMTADDWLADTRASYDTVAGSYAEQMSDALAGAPFVRAALGLFAGLVHAAGGGRVADVGCGPGHVTAHLNELGVDVFGIDLSPKMIEVARRDHPGLRFAVSWITGLGVA